jgi:exodeoxyribonuclease-3
LTRLLSWNVNGLRAIHRKGFREWFLEEGPDILCLQEIKAAADKIPGDLKEIPGYRAHFSPAERGGYSGVAAWTRLEPRRVNRSLEITRLDREGRMLELDFGSFVLFNVYFPNGGRSQERLQYKLDFYETFLAYVARIKRRRVAICGDFNTAHHEIDLARPRENLKNSGFLPEERVYLDRLEEHGFTDTFRMFNAEGGNYTWWDYQTRARERNVGWRIDYFFVSRLLKGRVSAASILPEVMGSDHCPVELELDL